MEYNIHSYVYDSQCLLEISHLDVLDSRSPFMGDGCHVSMEAQKGQTANFFFLFEV